MLKLSLAVLVCLTAGVAWLLLRSLGEEDGSAVPPEEVLEAGGSPETAPPMAEDHGPGIEVVGLDVVAGTAADSRAETSDGSDGKLVLGAGGEPIGDLSVRRPSPVPGPRTQPGAGSVAGAGQAGGEAQKRAWEPLVQGPDLPGWQWRSPEGWSVDGTLLKLRVPAGAKTPTVLVTTTSYTNLALTVKGRPDTAAAVFGMLSRAQGGGAIRLEFIRGKSSLRAGDQMQPIAWDWPARQWHQVAMIVVDRDVLVYVDRRKIASLMDVAVEGPGRIGVYCTSGSVDMGTMFVQALD